MDRWTCLIVGGGPAGMMLGYLLARSGVRTILVEKHGDFFRDFRGDTVHPSTTELLHELGLLDEFLAQVPHVNVEQLGIGFKGQTFDLVDFRHLPTACKYVAFMPQWDFLYFLAGQAERYPSFRRQMNTEVTDLLWEGDRVVGVAAQTPAGAVEIRADVTVACDGRWSVLDTDWFDTAAAAPGPYLFVCEGVFIYLAETQVRTVLTQLAARFGGSLIAFDTVGALMVRNQHRNGSMHAVAAKMQWVCDDPRDLERWGPKLLCSRTFARPQPEVGTTWPLRYRYGLPVLARLVPCIVNSFKCNLFRLGD